MKKLFLSFCVAGCLIFSATTVTTRAADGNGHDAGFQCIETTGCSSNRPLPEQQGVTSDSSSKTDEDMPLTLLDLIIKLFQKS